MHNVTFFGLHYLLFIFRNYRKMSPMCFNITLFIAAVLK